MTITRVFLPVLAGLSFLVAIGSWRFMLVGLEEAFQGAPFEAFLQNDRLIFVAHVVSSPVALALGAIQLLPAFRNRSFARHRIIGRLYGVSILVGGVSAVLLTLSMWDRPIAALGFLMLGALWIGTTWYAIVLARKGDISGYKDWMIRSFALTASALTLRLYLSGFMAAGYDYYDVSYILAWACWVPNLLLAELILARKPARQHWQRQTA